ncbi:hypothetical protein A2714_01845 [Candidatus Woesebacteria bacterium RIFCSPHIGHO2_01_FULL_38_9]|uniref:Type IV pilus modification protein PilV n=2 Tax=Candidatus Woeseibacteriota TaxID=1752722 RepID=A0A1F7Y172_9BACT|nr:MAG: hypothetical protein A2714_01845 [Candidatus Woesebacteria bacterium RIFCSPHIGHO2_01_FULL_38_9]OGM58572.1 MAG: hypothetical protein A3A75_02530 [Candidatus Woesebacteria bacterium RIFCSPLOWO2_01_FULL_39_10]
MFKLKSKIVRGQSLFEVVIALGVMSFILVGIVSLAGTSIRNSTFSNNNALASKYTQEGMEWIRQERDTTIWSTFSARDADNSPSPQTATSYCISGLTWVSGPCGSTTITGTIFTREADLTWVNSDTTDVDVRVSWTDAQGTHTVRSSTLFTNWNR